MILSNFIFDGKIENIYVGSKLSINTKLDLIQIEEGNIPSLYEFCYEDLYFQITIYKDLIIGIQFDFEYDIDRKYILNMNNNKLKIGYGVSNNKVQEYLKKISVEYSNKVIDNKNSDLTIIKSGVSLLFFDDKLYKANLFDLDIYNKLI